MARQDAAGTAPPGGRARRNRVPGRLVCAGLAVLLFLAPQAWAQTQVWSADITTGTLGTLIGVWPTRSTPVGSMTDEDFVYDGTTYNFTHIRMGSGGGLQINMNRAFTATAMADLTFQVGSASFALADATGTNPLLSWESAGLSWSDGDTIAVKMVAATNTAPVFPASTATRSVAENTAAGQNVGSPLTADDDDGDTLTYTLEDFAGFTDAASFDIVSGSGQIQTRSGVTYDHEAKDTYVVVVRASDDEASGSVDVTITVTDENEPPAAPAAPTVAATSGSVTSLDVRWTAPANAGKPAIDSYDVQYRAGSTGPWTNGAQDVTPRRSTIGGLTANTAYEVRVRATNDEGDGDWSPSGTGTTNDPTATVHVLASNLDQPGTHDLPTGVTTTNDVDLGFGFETGDNPVGYALASVQLKLKSTDAADGVQVSVYSESGGEPDTSLYTLTRTAPSSWLPEEQLYTFTPPAGSILQKETKYFVVLEATAATGRYEVVGTTSDATDSLATGWSLDIERVFRLLNNLWSTGTQIALIKISGRGGEAIAPVVTGATVDGATLEITFDEDLAAAANLANGAFTVKKTPSGGTAETVALTGSPAISGTTVTLTLDTAVASVDTVTVGYAKPTSGTDNALEDVFGNAVADFTDQAVTNETAGDPAEPVLATVDGTSLVITFDEKLGAAANLANGAFTVKKTPDGGSEATVALTGSPAIDRATVTLTLGTAVAATDTDVKVSYAKPTSGTDNILKDAVGDEVADFTDLAVVNATGATCTEQELRLLGGDINREGSVQICHNNQWGHVCDDDWEKVDADVACKQLGYTNGAQRATIHSEFVSLINVKYWLDDVACTGSETTLSQCASAGWGVNNCQFSERAGAVCKANSGTTNIAATGTPGISGTAVVGQVLTASTDGISDANGNTKADNGDTGFVYTYQWFRVDSNGTSNKTTLTGETAATYTLVAADQGKKVIVEVSFTDDESNPEGPLASAAYPATGTVQSSDTVAPTVDSATVDSTALVITFNENLAAAASLANSAFEVKRTPPGEAEATVTLTGSPAISGATVTLTLDTAVIAGDAVTVSYTEPNSGTANALEDAAGNQVADFTETVTNDTEVVNNPATGVALDGTAQVGMTLTALTADIEDEDGLTGATFAFQWSSGGDDVAGATGSTYTVREADIGKNVSVRVSFKDDANNDEAPTKSTRRKVMPAASDNCDTLTVWCATLTAGVFVDLEEGLFPVQAGYRPASGYGSLAPPTFTHRGVEYTVTQLSAGGTQDLYFTTTPNLPADGAGLTLHVQRVVGELSLPLTSGAFRAEDGRWFFQGAVNTSATLDGHTFDDVPLLDAPFSRGKVEPQPTEEGTEIAVRLSTVPEEDVGEVLVSNAGQFSDTNVSLHIDDLAQGFVTGADAGGYALTAVEVTFAGTGDLGAATLHKDSPNDAVVATLSGPADVPGAQPVRFTAPAGTTLEPNSTYYVLLDGGDAALRITSQLGEDADGLPDWEILDVVHFRAHDSTGALAEGNANPLLIRVFGHVNPDPGAPTAGFAQSTYSVDEGGTVAVEVELSVSQDAAVTIPITATGRRGASSGTDYTGVPGSVTFAVGETSKTFTVVAVDDAADDDGENVLLELGTLPQGLAAGIASTVIEIEDDDGAAPASGQLRLAGGPDRFEGRLEVFFRGEWGSTCDDRFFEPSGNEENRAPDVACKLLGFKSGAQAAGYGRPHLGVTNEHNRNAPRFAENEPIWLDDVRCLASMPTHRVDDPQSIFDCYYAGPGLHNCTHEEDVGLRCSNTSNAGEDPAPGAVGGLIVSASGSDGLTVLWQVPAGPTPTGYNVEYRTTGGNWADWSHSGVGTTTTITGLDPATDYEVRVRGTNADGEGDWSPTGSGRTGPASGQQGAALTAWFEDVPASHDGMAKLTLTLKFSAPITTRVRTLRTERLVVTNATLNWVRRVDRGAEGTSAFTMRITPAGAATVTVSLPADGTACDAGGVCTADGVQLSQGATATVPGSGAEAPDAPSVPTLTAGETWLEASWTAPDDNGSAITDYDVDYRESGGNWTDANHAGTATTKRIEGLTAETDYEVRVRATNAEGTGDWSPAASGRTTAAAGAADGDVRLVGGTTAQEGRVEIYHDGEWGTVCDDYFASDDAAVVCRQLGYTGGEAHAARSTFGVGTGTIWMDDVQCAGSESRLANCAFAGWGIENCRHSEDVGVSCGAASGMSLTRAMVSGTELTLRYDRPLDGGSVPSPGDFVVASGSSDSAAALPIDAVAVADGAAVLTLARAVDVTEEVSVNYLPAPMHPLQDASYNPAPAFTGQPVLHAPAVAPADVAALPAPLPEAFAGSQAKVEVLDLSAHGLADLSALSGLADLQTLDLGGNRVADLGPLAALAGLERLDLGANAVADLAPLGALAHLRVLDLSGNAVTDVSPLAALTALRRLNLSGNRVTDLRPLSELHGLEVLLLGGNEISNLVPLWGLTELAHLGLGDNRIADAALLRELRSLQRLDLAGNRLRDVSVLGDMPQLVWLHLAGNPIADFSPLGRLTAMRWLVLDTGASPLQAVPVWPGGERAPLLLIETTHAKASDGL